MDTDPSPEILAELAALRARVAKQEEELAALRGDDQQSGASRRALFKGAGALAGGLALATAVGGNGKVAALQRAPGVDVPMVGGPIALALKANGIDILGDSTREESPNAIDCLSFDSTVRIQTASTGQASG